MREEHSIRLMCNVLKVSSSGFYDWEQRNKNKLPLFSKNYLSDLIEGIFIERRGTYGHRNIHSDLNAMGVSISFRSVLNIMKEKDLHGVPFRGKPYPKPEDMPESKIVKHRLNRKFDVNTANKYWAGDITYLWTDEGWLYLAVVIDLYSRKVVGWATSDKPDTELTNQALSNAVGARTIRRWRLMFHSDQGCQYTSKSFRDKLEGYGILQSMSRRGQCWDNAPVESFFGTFKQETGINRWPLATKKETKELVLDWVESWYNTQRNHSKLDYCSPTKFEEKNQAA